LGKIIFIAFLIIIWALFIEPNLLFVKKYTIYDSQLKGLKVVFAGDFHIGKNQQKRLEKIVAKINQQDADLILSIGDFVKGHEVKSTLRIEILAKVLSEAKSKYGFYTVLGNHDMWIYGKGIAKVLEDNGIKVLNNENISLNIDNKTLYIAGVEDMTTGHYSVNEALKDVDSPVILLSHQPDIYPKIKQKVNLILAGHTHGGQVRLPLIGALLIPSRYGKRFDKSFVEEKNNNKMIITKGLGTSILPVRFNCVPEIVVIEFK